MLASIQSQNNSQSRQHTPGPYDTLKRAVASLSWSREQDRLETRSRYPPPREQRDVAGRHYLTKSEIHALYFSTDQLKCPRGWTDSRSMTLPATTLATESWFRMKCRTRCICISMNAIHPEMMQEIGRRSPTDAPPVNAQETSRWWRYAYHWQISETVSR